jgi:hypothetical protein
MKNSKAIIFFAVLCVIAGLTGCTKDSGTSDPGRAAFIGDWMASPAKLTYDVKISEDPNSSNGVFIANFALIGFDDPPASAEISGSTIVLDANQVIGTNLVVNGSGVLNGTKITWNYTTFDGADLTEVTEIYTKK